MKRYVVSWIELLVIGLLFSCLPAAAQSGWNLTFQEESSGSALDASKWTAHYPADPSDPSLVTCTLPNNGELESYEPANVTEGAGLISLTAMKQSAPCNGTTQNYTSGMIQSCGPATAPCSGFAQTYGYFEIEVQVPASQGLWPAFWLLPASGDWPPEIDVIELGNNGDFTTARMTNHFGPSGSGSYDSQTWSNTGTPFGSTLHTFAVDWEPGVLNFYVDGIKRGTITAPSCPATPPVGGSGPECISSVPMYMIADLAVGGSYTGGVLGSTPFPSSMTISHIRAYQHPATGTGCYATIPPAGGPVPSPTCTIVPTPLSLSTSTLPAGVVGYPYSAALAATGGTTPYTWTATGLAAGLSLNAATGVISGTPTLASAYSESVTVTDSASPTPATVSSPYSVTIAAAPPVGPTLRVRAGTSTAYTDPSGNVWAADKYYSGGSTAAYSHAISNTTTQPLYQAERYNAVTYTFTGLPVGAPYALTLKFAEDYWTASGKRVFNVLLNGAAVLSNFDIFKDAGGEFIADDKTFTTTATASGTVVVQLQNGSADYAKVDAIQLLPAGPPAISVTVAPTPVSMLIGATQQFTSTVANDPLNGGVTWTSTGGTITSSGLFTAPTTAGSYKVTATSVTDITKSATVSVTVTLPPASWKATCTGGVAGSGVVNCTFTGSNIASGTAFTATVTGGGATASAAGSLP